MEKVPITKLKLYSKNPRQISDEQFQALCDGLIEHGFVSPLIVNQDNIVLGGNQRLKAVRKLVKDGHKEFKSVPIHRYETIDDAHLARAAMIDNNEFGEYDFQKLSGLLTELSIELEELPSLGFTELEVGGLVEINKINVINASDENSEWVGMPEFEAKDKPFQLIISFQTKEDREDFEKKYKIKILQKQDRVWSTWYPYKSKEDLSSLRFDNEK